MYFRSPAWKFRAGGAFDPTPIKNAELRTPRIPDNDRLWLAAGASYQPTKNLIVDVAAAHLFVEESDIDNVEEATKHRLAGNYDFSVYIVSAHVTWNLQ